ncbi:DoxX family membrane protein [Pseudomonas sp. R5(2019)]|nr:DoxX family protein [Pseudomonas sp. R5(2019)]NBA93529.1 DoxX family membrane protein [Pseudomonas sp. R5(2019)]
MARTSPPLSKALNRLPACPTSPTSRAWSGCAYAPSTPGFAVDLISGNFELGMPHLADSTIPLFRSEYPVPLLAPEVAAPMAAFAEHFFPLLILVGFATRFSALALLGITLVIQTFVYPDAYPTHGTWAAVLLYLMARGPGVLSIDHLIARR